MKIYEHTSQEYAFMRVQLYTQRIHNHTHITAPTEILYDPPEHYYSSLLA